MYGRHRKYFTMRSSYFTHFERSWIANFERSWGVELRAKLGRTSSEVGPKFERSWAEVRAKLNQSLSKVPEDWREALVIPVHK